MKLRCGKIRQRIHDRVIAMKPMLANGLAILRLFRRFKDHDEYERMLWHKTKKIHKDEEESKDREKVDRDKITKGKMEYHERKLEYRKTKEQEKMLDRIRRRLEEFLEQVRFGWMVRKIGGEIT